MLWFEGSIPEAIGSAKSRGLVFVVVVSGECAAPRRRSVNAQLTASLGHEKPGLENKRVTGAREPDIERGSGGWRAAILQGSAQVEPGREGEGGGLTDAAPDHWLNIPDPGDQQ